jgi:hypothetical protein
MQSLCPAWTPVRYEIAVYCSNGAVGLDLPYPTRWAIVNGLDKKPLIERRADTPKAANDAALKAFACMVGS